MVDRVHGVFLVAAACVRDFACVALLGFVAKLSRLAGHRFAGQAISGCVLATDISLIIMPQRT